MSFLKPAQRAGRKFLNPVEARVGGLRIMFKVLPLYLANREERFPQEPIGPFRTDASVYATAPASGLRVTWMGHSSLLVEIDGVTILIDPMWDERASPLRWAGPKRFYPPTMALEELPRLDVVLVSHDHYDHLGQETMKRLAHLEQAAGAQWICPLQVGELLRGFGIAAERVQEMDWMDSVSVKGCRITALPSRHFSGRSLSNRFETLWASYVLKGPEHTVFFGADSGWWEGYAEIGQRFGPFDLTLLEIGAYNDLWKDIHLGPDGAVRAFEALGGQGLLMPIHWGLFDLALHAWRQPIERMVQLAGERGIRLWSPEPGRPEEVKRGVELRSGWWRRL